MERVDGRLPETWAEAVDADRRAAGLSVPAYGRLFGKEKTWAYEMLDGESSPGFEGLEIHIRNTGGLQLLDWICRMAKATWHLIDPGELEALQTAKSVKEFAEYLESAATARDEDGRISAKKLARVKKEAREAVLAIEAHVQALERDSLRVIGGRAASLAEASERAS